MSYPDHPRGFAVISRASGKASRFSNPNVGDLLRFTVDNTYRDFIVFSVAERYGRYFVRDVENGTMWEIEVEGGNLIITADPQGIKDRTALIVASRRTGLVVTKENRAVGGDWVASKSYHLANCHRVTEHSGQRDVISRKPATWKQMMRDSDGGLHCECVSSAK